MVVLETLNSALQEQESLAPGDQVRTGPGSVLRLLLCLIMTFLHHQTSSGEAENRQEEQRGEQEGNQSGRRKRSAVDRESDMDTNRTRHLPVLRGALVLVSQQIQDVCISI